MFHRKNFSPSLKGPAYNLFTCNHTDWLVRRYPKSFKSYWHSVMTSNLTFTRRAAGSNWAVSLGQCLEKNLNAWTVPLNCARKELFISPTPLAVYILDKVFFSHAASGISTYSLCSVVLHVSKETCTSRRCLHLVLSRKKVSFFFSNSAPSFWLSILLHQ